MIYFLLAAGDVSRWHRVSSDETWHFHEGDVLDLCVADPRFDHLATHRLGTWSGQAAPVHVVPAGSWQAARTTGAYTLVSCAVGPGFDFADFEMLRDRPGETEESLRKQPGMRALL